MESPHCFKRSFKMLWIKRYSKALLLGTCWSFMYFEYFSRVTEEVHIFNFLKNKQLNYLLESNAETNPPYIQVLWWLVDCWGWEPLRYCLLNLSSKAQKKTAGVTSRLGFASLFCYFLTVQLILQLSNSNLLEGEKRPSELF